MTIPPMPGQRHITLNPLSTCSIQLYMQRDSTSLSTGTCFFWEHEGTTYLVTNWHNVTGKNARTLDYLDVKNLAEPNNLLFGIFLNRDLNDRRVFRIPLYDDRDKPLWFEHAVFRNHVDVVCIELPTEAAKSVFPINKWANGPIIAGISDDVFVIGYPLGISVETTPIWKRASVASEPDFDIGGLPMMYVDTASSRGMSGSPVVRYSFYGKTAAVEGVTMFSKPESSFAGIYSGRIVSSNSLDAQLGIVWKQSAIEDIIRFQARGDNTRWQKL